ncbi:Selenocysteine-specific elongation factor [Galdieria sulphuraria]|uniref:Selenocysteine-specific elongation factor-like protein n=1 Tax=Galdieria sulphuraria TaxID=130081 RepID=M2W4E6_GALSU|nr:selenocysteine-specific elongation factor-like protein [Galdieria sulphuraria]EME30626.1 selenocysteine-specific elongation factor-like protein [Galdieria sulphuraria]GJD09023.1 Selenocysteine-specific elongation factor [Galdieria sulphuraria]|eukprot:XP_005707146.1 selenocysteine-specific elongation factor-like protein [Galdieria sulphuraria]
MNKNTININIGVLGHVDSGKTSLVRSISTILSTAALDKHPQSSERGITLDLGFSAFMLQKDKEETSEQVQITLVDCPGHASLLKTVLGGSKIIDALLLVIDVTKGIQMQTSECIVVGELVTDKAIIVFSKIDLIPPDERTQKMALMKKRTFKALQQTKFKDAPYVFVAANPSQREKLEPHISENVQPWGMEELLSTIAKYIPIPERSHEGKFLFAFDHCFGVKGHGTVFTGTVLQGAIHVGDLIHIPNIGISRKVKSMQIYRKPVTQCGQGERVAICISRCPSDKVERGFLAIPGYLSLSTCFITSAHKVRFYREECLSKSKFHVTVGHSTAVATVTFFSMYSHCQMKDCFSFDERYFYEKQLENDDRDSNPNKIFFALIKTDIPLCIYPKVGFIASRLDWDTEVSRCRIAFHGDVLAQMHDTASAVVTDKKNDMLHLTKIKKRQGTVERIQDNQILIVKGFFQKDANVEIFEKMRVSFENGVRGYIEGKFGKSGKLRVRLLSQSEKIPETGSKVEFVFHKVFSVDHETKKKNVYITQEDL